jgi:hypothetical protein
MCGSGDRVSFDQHHGGRVFGAQLSWMICAVNHVTAVPRLSNTWRGPPIRINLVKRRSGTWALGIAAANASERTEACITSASSVIPPSG